MEEMEVPSDVFLFMGDESEDGKRKGASRLPFGPRVYSVLFRYPLDVEFIPIRCPIRPISVIHILSSAPSFFSRPVQTYLSIVVTANFPLIDLWDFDGLETEAKDVIGPEIVREQPLCPRLGYWILANWFYVFRRNAYAIRIHDSIVFLLNIAQPDVPLPGSVRAKRR